MQKRIECVITGRVQMVMFRDFAQRKARGLGLVGTVENLSDGSVVVIAEGKEEALRRFIALLHQGSLLSKVEEVKTGWKDATGEFSKFSILFA